MSALEYKVLGRMGNRPTEEEQLNTAAKEGWELKLISEDFLYLQRERRGVRSGRRYPPAEGNEEG